MSSSSRFQYAEVILPLAAPADTFCYAIPEGMLVQVGLRVEVSFGKAKRYSGIIAALHNDKPDFEVKELIQVLDDSPITTEVQIRFWRWMSQYYCCTLGEVMSAALPGNLKLSSETRILYVPEYGDDFNGFSDDEFLIAEALLLQKEITVEDARKILGKKTVLPVVQSLMQRGVAMTREELVEKFKPKTVTAVRLCEPYRSDPSLMQRAFNLVGGAEKHENALLAFLSLSKGKPYVLKQELVNKTELSDNTLTALRKKGILETYFREVSRLGAYEEEFVDVSPMSDLQAQAWQAIRSIHSENKPVLLFGVTGSGKTRLYAEAVKETLQANKQVLYLVPEIGLTTQLVNRLKRIFGEAVLVYHSRISYSQRTEIYQAISKGGKVILSARSGIFLPFKDLGLIVIDEEHDPSYKQTEPAPRYQARDAAIILAHLTGAKVILGSGTPALESWHNVQEKKYGLVQLPERYGNLEMPKVEVIDLKKAASSGTLRTSFSHQLINAAEQCIAQGEQVIMFQNLRGFAPVQLCQACHDWSARCPNCDISLTYHKHTNRLCCHYCAYHTPPFSNCPKCKSPKVVFVGHGTERLEDDLGMLLPKAKIARMDYDTAGSKAELETLLHDFEEKRIDVLVGTQMVTKGLDFEHVGLVGVIQADQLLRAPHFRASERAWQLLVQVSGRAGRKHKQGLVLIQAWRPEQLVIQEALTADFLRFATRELAERKRFKYPPYYRLIHLTLRHKNADLVEQAADFFAKELKKQLGERVHGPSPPAVARVRGYYLRQIMLKLEKDKDLIKLAKDLILETENKMSGIKGLRQADLLIDVDP